MVSFFKSLAYSLNQSKSTFHSEMSTRRKALLPPLTAITTNPGHKKLIYRTQLLVHC